MYMKNDYCVEEKRDHQYLALIINSSIAYHKNIKKIKSQSKWSLVLITRYVSFLAFLTQSQTALSHTPWSQGHVTSSSQRFESQIF